MDKSYLFDLTDEILQHIESFVSGDLICLMEIQEAFRTLNDNVALLPVKNLNQLTEILYRFTFLLEQDQYESDILSFLKQAVLILKKLSKEKEERKEAVEEIKALFSKINLFMDDFSIELPKLPEKNDLILHKSAKKEVKTKENLEDASNKNLLNNLYPQNYFNNIIEDKQMLSQLCDEALEHLDSAQFTLLELEYDSTNQENINTVFRNFHTIKGSSSFLGLKNIEEVAHHMENLLMLVRDGKIKVDRDLIDLIFFGIELLRNLIDIMQTHNLEKESMTESFSHVNIFSYIDLIEKVLKEYQSKKIGEILAEEGILHEHEVQSILETQTKDGGKFGEIAVLENKVREEDVVNAINKQKKIQQSQSKYVRVSNERLNQLIDIVGELVINQSMLKQGIMENEKEQADRMIAQLEGITTNIKNLVLSMGMVPVSQIFNKLKVVIRNTAKELGKTVIVDIHGEDTELDKNVIEAIYDPLVHMTRNAVDHGLESPDERAKKGKDRVGKITISAEHKGNGILISVKDNGKGIDREQILKKAIDKELITEEETAQLTEKEVFNFLFAPGFSTAQKVTEISGRGVGMDVVKKNIESIRGKIEINSELNSYSMFSIKLPLTLAIIEGFVSEVNKKRYVFPFDLVEEIIVPNQKTVRRMEDGNLILYHRNHHIPLIFSAEIFKEENVVKELKDKMVILLISFEEQYFGIVVDQVLGKQETVIKNLSEALNTLSVFSGGTIFGDGTIGFVVDVEEFLIQAKKVK